MSHNTDHPSKTTPHAFAYRLEDARGQHRSTWPSLSEAYNAAKQMPAGFSIFECYSDGSEKLITEAGIFES